MEKRNEEERRRTEEERKRSDEERRRQRSKTRERRKSYAAGQRVSPDWKLESKEKSCKITYKLSMRSCLRPETTYSLYFRVSQDTGHLKKVRGPL